MTDDQTPNAAQQKTSHRDLDSSLKTTKPQTWVAVTAIAVALVVALTWSVVATIPMKSTATGVLNNMRYGYSLTAPAAGFVQLTGIENGIKEKQQVGTVTSESGDSVPLMSLGAGEVVSLFVMQNQYVELGDAIASISFQPALNEPIELITFVGESDMDFFPVGGVVQLSAVDTASGARIHATGTIQGETELPATDTTMLNVSAQSQSLTDDWMTASDGYPFAIFIASDDWPTGDSGFVPRGGQIVNIERVYTSVRPISRLFGKG